MRELERDHTDATTSTRPLLRVASPIVGAGRAGGSIAERSAGRGHGGRGRLARARPGRRLDRPSLRPRRRDPRGVRAPSLRRLSRAPSSAMSAARPGSMHSSAATDAGCQTFSLHPLQTIPTAQTDLSGAPCAISASTPTAATSAHALAERLGMRPFDVPEEGRAAYHAAASMASNFLIALEESAAELMEAAGVPDAREVLAPLVLRTRCQLGRRRRGRAHRPDRPRRRGDRRAPPGGARQHALPSCARSTRRSPSAPASWERTS